MIETVTETKFSYQKKLGPMDQRYQYLELKLDVFVPGNKAIAATFVFKQGEKEMLRLIGVSELLKLEALIQEARKGGHLGSKEESK